MRSLSSSRPLRPGSASAVLLAALLTALLTAAAGCAGDDPLDDDDDDDDDAGEGEGEAGEGEGEAGEGEGEAGEGEGEAGEGEGEAGEGEGEAGEGEGEGEGEAGEGEGEGEGVDVDVLDVTLDFTGDVDISPTGDIDCFRFTLDAPLLVTAELASSCSSGGGDPFLRLFDDATNEALDTDDDGGAGLCSRLSAVLEPGTYRFCAEELGNNSTILGMTIAITAVEVPPDDHGGRGAPTPVDANPFNSTSAVEFPGDEDCFSFTASDGDFLQAAVVTPTCASFGDNPRLALFRADAIGTQVDSDDNTGEGNCPLLLDSELTAGDWVLCVNESGDDDVTEQGTLIILVQQETVLGEGELCAPGSDIAPCDTGVECLSVDNPLDFRCTVETLLPEGAGCLPGTTANVCEPQLACVDDGGGGFQCVNPDVAGCANVVELDASVQFSGEIPADTDLLGGTCSTTARDELVLHFAPNDFPLQKVSFTGTNLGLISVRTACEDRTSEVECAFGNTASVVGVAGGTDLFVIVEDVGGGPFTLDVLVEEIAERFEGEACGIDSDTELCSAGLVCAEAGDTDLCAAPVLVDGSLGGEDATFTRASSSCTANTNVVPFDVFTVTNDTATATTLTVLTQDAADPVDGECDPDTVIFAYEAFDPADATAQCIDGDDDGGGGFHCSQLQVPLAANASVQIVVTGFNDTDVGPYQLGVLSPGTTVTIDPL